MLFVISLFSHSYIYLLKNNNNKNTLNGKKIALVVEEFLSWLYLLVVVLIYIFLSSYLSMDSQARRMQSSSGRGPAMRVEGEEEFEEEDVWSVLRDGETSGPERNIPKSHFSSPSSSTSFTSSPWNIHRSKEASGAKQSSAPMNVPDWSKVYGNTRSDGRSNLHSHDDDDDVDDDGCMVPPHEWVARKLARTQISSFSMCEGVGRTLKGRDLSKMRNAVLTKTGFLE